ncbi:hypothetical protein HHK36_012001 [Tetracentron sinense]|uniref:Uncharacterized protein n=1 Tax=Tetracentron sinense TaxID=13715 RepID=A0A834ZBP9_TETSI|nr:hypothetical protein HHK36_012001 [Tetracentron sinense]
MALFGVRLFCTDLLHLDALMFSCTTDLLIIEHHRETDFQVERAFRRKRVWEECDGFRGAPAKSWLNMQDPISSGIGILVCFPLPFPTPSPVSPALRVMENADFLLLPMVNLSLEILIDVCFTWGSQQLLLLGDMKLSFSSMCLILLYICTYPRDEVVVDPFQSVADNSRLSISPEDIRWEGEDPGMSRRGGRGGPGRGFKKSAGRGGGVPGAGRGRGAIKGQSKKDLLPSQNGIGKKASVDIEILHTDMLIKEVERIFGASHPDPLEIEKAKKVLKEHEQALVDAIARLADASDGESDDGEHAFSHGQSMDRELGWKNRKYGTEEGRGDGLDGNQMARGGRVASDDPQDGDEGVFWVVESVGGDDIFIDPVKSHWGKLGCYSLVKFKTACNWRASNKTNHLVKPIILGSQQTSPNFVATHANQLSNFPEINPQIDGKISIYRLKAELHGKQLGQETRNKVSKEYWGQDDNDPNIFH